MVPEPSAEGWDALTRAWLDECDAIARREHYRQAAPIRDLFETDLDHMLPLPGTPFDACDWRSVKTDRTGTALIDGNRYLAGPRWRSMRLRAGVRALDIEMRGPDGEYIVTLERVWGHEPRTVMEPTTLLAIIARKPRMWGESPIRGDFPENVRDLPDTVGWTGARRPGRRHQACVLDQRVRGRRQGRVRDHRCRTPARPRLDRPDRTQDQAGRRGHRTRPRSEPIQHLHGGKR